MGRPQAETTGLWGLTRLAKVPKGVFHMELQFSACPQLVIRSSRRAQHGGKTYFCVRAKGDRAHPGVPACTSPVSGCLQRTHGEGSRLWVEKEQELAPKEARPWFGHLSSRFHPSLEGQLQGLSGMPGTGAGEPIPLHPTMSKETEKPHNHPLFPHHSCSDSCNSASINPCPLPAGLNWGGGSAQAAVELGCNPGGNLHPLPHWGCSGRILLPGRIPCAQPRFCIIRCFAGGLISSSGADPHQSWPPPSNNATMTSTAW